MNSGFKIYAWYFKICVLINVKYTVTYFEIIFTDMHYSLQSFIKKINKECVFID